MAGELSAEDMKALATKFDSTSAFVKLDGQLIRAMGYNADLCQANNDQELMKVGQLMNTVQNFPVTWIKEKLGGAKYVIVWIVFFRGRTNVPLDVLAEGLSHLSQIKSRDQKNFDTAFNFLIEFAKKGKFCVDLNNGADVEMIKKAID